MTHTPWFAVAALAWGACAADAAASRDVASDTANATELPDLDTAGNTDNTVEPETSDSAATSDDPNDGTDPDATDAADTSPPRTHGLEQRVTNTTCFLPGAPPLDVVPIATRPVYPDLLAPNACAVVTVPGRDALAVVTRTGTLRAFASAGSGADAAMVLDLTSAVRTDGLRAAIYRPDGQALIASFLPAEDPLRLVVARFPLGPDGRAQLAAREDLATVAVTDPARAGGALAFLFDGTLVVALGDGGDPLATADPSSLAGKVLRLGVASPPGEGATIPSDNPFVGSADTRPEIYALGLGAPTSCSVDRITGRLWCADAGGAGGDAIVIVTPGATLAPIRKLPRTGCGLSVGFVSRDATLPDVQGALVYADRCTPALAALRFDGSLIRSEGPIATLPAPLAAFGEDADGRMLVATDAGTLHALVRPATPAPAFPTTVSATGCLAPRDGTSLERQAAASLIPFEVRTPLWSDGAKKRRFLSLPGVDTIGFTTTGAWRFPDGTLFMKEFLLDDDDAPATAPRIMETRFFVKRSETQWEGYSYMWDREGREGFLLDGAEIGRYPMAPGVRDAGGASIHRHTFPDRVQCLLCHNADAGRALGLQTGRMNTDHDYDGFVENQLAAMDHIGLFGATPLPAAPDALPRFAEPSDVSAPLEARARSWLYANCSHCHRPSSVTPVSLDFRYETPFGDTHTCGLRPKYTLAQLPNASIIDPGHADNSEMFFRLARRDANQMPPIATLIVEPVGVDAVRAWIDSLTGCPASP